MDNLTYKLMCEIGLDIENSYIIDQDFGALVHFNGRTLRYSEEKTDINLSRNDIFFDPLNNSRLMVMVFSYYLNKLHNTENRYFYIYYPIYNNKNGTGSVEVKSDSEIYRSNEYISESLRYIDLIFKMSGTDIDLSMYDTKRG